MDRFRTAIQHLLSLTTSPSPQSRGQELCRAFLEVLSSEPASESRTRASEVLLEAMEDSQDRELASFLRKGIEVMEQEIKQVLESDGDFRTDIETLANAIGAPENDTTDLTERYWAVFLPEAVGVAGGWNEKVRRLRNKREVSIDALCPTPIQNPAKELLWTSNALLTVPSENAPANELHLDETTRRALAAHDLGKQKYWYDHPVQIGVSAENNEILYGLRGLSQMFAFEKERGTAAPEDRLEVVLSVSVTHPGLHRIARPYIESILRQSTDVHDLDIYIFTEEDTQRLTEDVLNPAARLFDEKRMAPETLETIFGVDGPYGRHYNFLKAVSAIWQTVRNPELKATFKIDLDQVFPQERLVEELSKSAFQLLGTPLWGATGRDQTGKPVELGMLAGALVNQADINQGLFTPDVKPASPPFSPDRWVFATQVPQALSTEAEMMTRYDGSDLDGKQKCLSRIHVTGGTTGIRVEALRRYRPFTLSTISRAEDQAYIMSVLNEKSERVLRYAHMPGLIMRHDKHSFAAGAIQTAAAGKTVGDYERMILFSLYAHGLPWSWEETHSSLEPFTGSFVSRTPFTTALLAFTLKALQSSGGLDTEEFLSVGVRKLGTLLAKDESTPSWLKQSYENEKSSWNAFYDVLGHLEEEEKKGSKEAEQIIKRARAIIAETQLHANW